MNFCLEFKKWPNQKNKGAFSSILLFESIGKLFSSKETINIPEGRFGPTKCNNIGTF